ncbi:MAG: carboxypeptidase-like regulatory domain-containing protein, partial [bacterium]
MEYRVRIKYILLVIVSLLLVNREMNYAQVSLHDTIQIDSSLYTCKEILQQLEKKGLSFSYKSSVLPDTLVYIPPGKDMLLDELLSRVFHPHNIDYKIIDKQVVLYEKPSKQFALVTGIIKNAETEKPVSFASITFKETPFGTISNQEGQFIYKIPVNYLPAELTISSLGYLSGSAEIKSDTSRMEIELTPVKIPIKEVIIKPVEPRKLIQDALKAVQENYPLETKLLTAFYRETTQQDAKYVVLAEAVTQIYKTSYSKDNSSDRIKVLKARKGNNVKSMDSIVLKLQGGPHTTLGLDLVKNRPSFMEPEFMKYYDFSFSDIIVLDTSYFYKIDFKPVSPNNYALFEGSFHVDRNDNAFKKIEFRFTRESLHEARDMLIKKTSPKIRAKPLTANYMVNYEKKEGKWHLSNLRTELIVKVRKRRFRRATTFKTIIEMAITNEESPRQIERFRRKETFKANDILVEDTGPYDYYFWGEQNIIRPEETL